MNRVFALDYFEFFGCHFRTILIKHITPAQTSSQLEERTEKCTCHTLAPKCSTMDNPALFVK